LPEKSQESFIGLVASAEGCRMTAITFALPSCDAQRSTFFTTLSGPRKDQADHDTAVQTQDNAILRVCRTLTISLIRSTNMFAEEPQKSAHHS
jgi:hypothetical protein